MTGTDGRERPRNEMRLELPSLTANVALARVAVAAFAGQLDFTLSDLEEIKVAVSEAFSNAVIHGYRSAGEPGAAGPVRIVARLWEAAVEIEVEDHGVGIADLERARRPGFAADPADPERMGLGFVFMESFMDAFHVESAPGKGTLVRLRKELRREPPVDGADGAATRRADPAGED